MSATSGGPPQGGGTVSRPPFNAPSITCPRCGAVSYHPVDVSQGYCNRCHDWTGSGPAVVTRAVIRLEYEGQAVELEITDIAGPVTSTITEPPPPAILDTANGELVRPTPPRTLTVTVSARRFSFQILDGQQR